MSAEFGQMLSDLKRVRTAAAIDDLSFSAIHAAITTATTGILLGALHLAVEYSSTAGLALGLSVCLAGAAFVELASLASFAAFGVPSFFRGIAACFRRPELATSSKFEEAKELQFGNEAQANSLRAHNAYSEAMKNGTPELQVKCAYGILSLAEKESNPVNRNNMLNHVIAHASPELKGTAIMVRVAHAFLSAAPDWLSALPLPERSAGLKLTERVCELAFKRSFRGNMEMAEELLTSAKSMASSPDVRHLVLRSAYGLAGRETVLRGTLEEMMIGNARDLDNTAHFRTLRDITRLRGISKEGRISIAGQLENLLPKLNGDDQLVANRLIEKLAPNGLQIDARAKARQHAA